MEVDEAFDAFQLAVDPEPGHLRLVRARRDVVRAVFANAEGVAETLASGSLARGTQCAPIHDVDVIVVFRRKAQPDWDPDWDYGGSAEEALEHVYSQLDEHLGRSRGGGDNRIREMDIRNHVVRCHLDVREDPDNPRAFAVEVMPAVRRIGGEPYVGSVRLIGGLRSPELRSDCWITTDPEYLIRRFARCSRTWKHFCPAVRMLREWKGHTGLDMKNLVVDILALRHLPHRPIGRDLERSTALSRFFRGAAGGVTRGVRDPAGHCGVIQPGLDREAAQKAMTNAADLAAEAVALELGGDHHGAIFLWHEVFGDKFPRPPGGSRPHRSGSTSGGRSRVTGIGRLGGPDDGVAASAGGSDTAGWWS